MGRIGRLATRWSRAALPRWTVRLRLTLVYGAVFLASGAALLTITYALVKQDIGGNFRAVTKNGTSAIIAAGSRGGVSVGFARIAAQGAEHPGTGGTSGMVPAAQSQRKFGTGNASVFSPTPGNFTIRLPLPADGKAPSPEQVRTQLAILRSEVSAARAAALRQLLFDSGIALVVMAACSILLGWLLAGRALRPLRVITAKAHDISATNLHERVGLQGPDDEMKRLGETFDDLLARLERAFDAQRQFVANASHELRTPLARQRTLLEVAAADPDADVVSLREAAAKAIEAGEEQERLIEALLTLASSERGLDERLPFDLGGVVADAVATKRPEAALRGIRVETLLSTAPATGNARLVGRLAANLIDNALRHNGPQGWVVVRTAVDGGRAVVEVANSGPVVPPGEIERLFEPFERLSDGRSAREGHGLGLSIVRAVATAHGGTVSAVSRPMGGLDVRVAFPLDVAAALRPDGPCPGIVGSGTAGGAGVVAARAAQALAVQAGGTVDAGSPATGD